jgi:GNAT superfamily N-acetyltransferase
MVPLAGVYADLLPQLQAVATRLWRPTTWQHAGQLAWNGAFADTPTPAAVWDGAAFGWLESPDSLELAVDPAQPQLVDDVVGWALARAAGPFTTTVTEADTALVHGLVRHGFAIQDGPFFSQLTLDLDGLPSMPAPTGYDVRAVRSDELEARAACHRAAWSDSTPSSMTAERYRRVTEAASYCRELDVVVEAADGSLVASALVWLAGEAALVEPVGCVPAYRGRGLAGAATLAALTAARKYGARVGLVRPRGDEAYRVPARLYRALGFRPVTRSLTLVGPASNDPEGS